MKKLIKVLCPVLIAAMLCAICLSGCGGKQESAENDKSSASAPTSAAVTEEKEWQKFIDEYDEWADKYIAAYNKYTADPTNTALLDELNSLAEKAEDWSKRADKIADELGETEDAEEFAAKLEKIADKLSVIA